MAAVSQCGSAINFAANRFKGDRELLQLAAKNDYLSFAFASDDLKNDKEFVMGLVAEVDGRCLMSASDILKCDIDVVLAAVKHNGGALQWAGGPANAERQVVTEAITNNGLSLQFANGSFNEERDMVMLAVTSDGNALEYASDSLKADKEVVMVAIKHKGSLLRFAAEPLKEDREVVLRAVECSGANEDGWSEAICALQYAPAFQSDRELVMIAVKSNPTSLMFASDPMKADKEVALLAVEANPELLPYCSDELQADEDLQKCLRKKEAFEAMNLELGIYTTPQAIQDIKEQFKAADFNEDGTLSIDELTVVFENLPGNVDAEAVKALIEAMDVNKDGQVNFSEFVDWVFSGGATHAPKESA